MQVAAEQPAGTVPVRGRSVGLGAVVAVLLSLGGPAAAQRGVDLNLSPVVLELYTAQGCSSCPPADEMLAALALREDVIALALHVDYWDYIGWADPFADPEHSERQKRYARRHGYSTIYTPQVVIDGTEILEGFRVMRIMELIDRQSRVERSISLQLTRGAGDIVEIHGALVDDPEPVIASRARGRGLTAMAAGADEASGPALHAVQLVRYRPRATVEITAGENAGLTSDFHNIVVHWQTVANWDARQPLQLSVRAEGTDPVVVIVQEAGQGGIVAAARLR